jgi:hypothetical protein
MKHVTLCRLVFMLILLESCSVEKNTVEGFEIGSTILEVEADFFSFKTCLNPETTSTGFSCSGTTFTKTSAHVINYRYITVHPEFEKRENSETQSWLYFTADNDGTFPFFKFKIQKNSPEGTEFEVIIPDFLMGFQEASCCGIGSFQGFDTTTQNSTTGRFDRLEFIENIYY